MPHRLSRVLVFIAAFWQALTLGGDVLAIGSAAGIGHAVLRWQEKPHHHHADGAISQDSSAESADHAAGDESLGDAALVLLPAALISPQVAPVRPIATEESALPSPYLDGLHRPPRRST